MLEITYTPPTLAESGSVSISKLKGKHAGSCAYVVGKGPSLMHLRAQDIGPGPVIVLNEAISIVQQLGLPNPIYSMQKDGCMTEDPFTIPRPCGTCEQFGWKRAPLIDPLPGIAVVFAQHLSSWCLHDRPNRYVFTDEELGYGQNPLTMSVLESIPFAAHLGATSIVMVSFDHLTHDETNYAEPFAEGSTDAIAQRSLATVKPQVLASLRAFGPHSFFTPQN